MTGVGAWSSPDLTGICCFLRSGGDVWSEENAVSGLVEDSCEVWWLGEQSTWMDWMSLGIWNSPSTVPMTATCRWTSVHGGIGSCLGISVGCGLWVVPPRCSLKSRRLVGLFPWLLVILGSMSFFSMSWRSRSESNGLSPAWLPRFLPLSGNIPGRGSRS